MEETDFMNKLAKSGAFYRYYGQKKAILLSVATAPADTVAPDLKTMVGENAVAGGVVIVCVFNGDKNIPFPEVRRYRTTTYKRLEKMIGQQFDIVEPEAHDVPVDDAQADVQAAQAMMGGIAPVSAGSPVQYIPGGE
jgi:hypothetical protein